MANETSRIIEANRLPCLNERQGRPVNSGRFFCMYDGSDTAHRHRQPLEGVTSFVLALRPGFEPESLAREGKRPKPLVERSNLVTGEP